MTIEYLWLHLAEKLLTLGKIKQYSQTQQGVKVKMNDSSVKYFTDEKEFMRFGNDLLK